MGKHKTLTDYCTISFCGKQKLDELLGEDTKYFFNMAEYNDSTIVQMTYGDLLACIRHEIERYEQSKKHRKDDMLTEREAAKYLNTSVSTIRRWVQRKDFPLPLYGIGGRNYYKIRDLDARIVQHKTYNYGKTRTNQSL